MTDVKSMTMEELKEFMTKIGEKPFRAKQIYAWLHQQLVTSWDEMTNLSKSLREKLSAYPITALTQADVRISKIDGTRKYLFRLEDGNVIESVLMRYHHGNSVCISSQVGCRMGCRFCASTIGGLTRCLELLRSMDYAEIRKKLMSVKNYGKIIVNAIDNIDVKIFCTALYRAIAQGKHYTFRTAAALVKAFGNISDKAYLAREEMVNKETAAGGIIVVGSHTAKTTAQLNELKNISDITFIELNSDLVLEEGKLEEETKRVLP